MSNSDIDDDYPTKNKEKHSKRYRRNMIAKSLREDLRGPFSMKVIDGRKSEYKRKRININNIEEEFEDDE